MNLNPLHYSSYPRRYDHITTLIFQFNLFKYNITVFVPSQPFHFMDNFYFYISFNKIKLLRTVLIVPSNIIVIAYVFVWIDSKYP